MQTNVSFQALGLDPALLKAVQRLGYTSPTQVQAEGIPAILGGRDVIGSARTGSGKTAAFLLPIIQRLAKHPARGTRVLVLSPTRELVVQTEHLLKDLARGRAIGTSDNARTPTGHGGATGPATDIYSSHRVPRSRISQDWTPYRTPQARGHQVSPSIHPDKVES